MNGKSRIIELMRRIQFSYPHYPISSMPLAVIQFRNVSVRIELPRRNNSIYAYKNHRSCVMWVNSVYSKVKEFLNMKDRVNLWAAHVRYLPDRRPEPVLNHQLNPAYSRWFLRQVPKIWMSPYVLMIFYEDASRKEWEKNTRAKIKRITGLSEISSRSLYHIANLFYWEF